MQEEIPNNPKEVSEDAETRRKINEKFHQHGILSTQRLSHKPEEDFIQQLRLLVNNGASTFDIEALESVVHIVETTDTDTWTYVANKDGVTITDAFQGPLEAYVSQPIGTMMINKQRQKLAPLEIEELLKRVADGQIDEDELKDAYDREKELSSATNTTVFWARLQPSLPFTPPFPPPQNL